MDFLVLLQEWHPNQSPPLENEKPLKLPHPKEHLVFKSAFHQARYLELVEDNLWYERVFNLSPEGPYKHIYEIFSKQEWGILLQPPRKVNFELVREFYANALPTNATDPFTFQTFVCGRDISFTRDAINQYLGNPYPLDDPNELCEYHEHLARGNFNHDEIERTILKAGRQYDVNDVGRKHRAKYAGLNLPAQVTLKLILHNIRPKSHISTTTLPVVALIYYVLKGEKVDIACTIANEMKLVTLQGKFPVKKQLPPTVHEEIKNPIDDGFIARNIEKKRRKTRAAWHLHLKHLNRNLSHKMSHLKSPPLMHLISLALFSGKTSATHIHGIRMKHSTGVTQHFTSPFIMLICIPAMLITR